MAERRFLVKTAYSVPLLLWLALIFGFSSQSYTEQSVQPFLTSHVSSVKLSARIPDWTIRYLEFIFRKCAHMFMYGMLAIWCYVALKPHSLNRAVKFGVVLLFAAMVAMTDEWNQTRAVQRTGAIQDVGIDMMGAAMGLAAVFLILVIQKKKQSR
jgi:VanZ family protein